MMFSLMPIRRDVVGKNATLAAFFVVGLHAGLAYLVLQTDVSFEKIIPQTIDMELVPMLAQPAPAPPQVVSVTKVTPAIVAPALEKVVIQPAVVAENAAPELASTEAVTNTPIESEPIAAAPLVAQEAINISPTPPSAVPVVEIVAPRFDADYLNNPRPPYPAAARRLRMQGTVILRVTVSYAGLPTDVRIVQSSGASILDQAALDVVRGWTFVPARQGEEKINAAVDVPIRFALN